MAKLKQCINLSSIRNLLLLILCTVGFAQFKVNVDLTCDDAFLKDRIASSIKKELRSLGDAEVDESNFDYAISVVIISDKNEFIAAVAYTKLFDNNTPSAIVDYYGSQYKVKLADSISARMNEHFQYYDLRELESLQVFNYGMKNVDEFCKRLVAYIDQNVFEETRQIRKKYKLD